MNKSKLWVRRFWQAIMWAARVIGPQGSNRRAALHNQVPAFFFIVLLVAAMPHAQAGRLGLDEMIEAYLRDAALPGLSVAIVRPGKDDYVRGFGVRSHGHPVPVDEHTLFKTNSITKSMTAVAVGRLVDAGKVRWTDRIVDYYPEFRVSDPWVTREVTFEDVMSHRVGVEATDWMEDLPGLSLEQAVYRLRYLPQVSPFRADFMYDNFMFSVAGLAAGRVARNWDELIESEVFIPLKMHDSVTRFERYVASDSITACHECDLDVAPSGLTAVSESANIAAPHIYVEGKARLSHWRWSNSRPAGAVWSSASDMARYVKLFLGEGTVDSEEVLSRDTFRQLVAPRIFTENELTAHLPRDSEYSYRRSQWHGAYAQGLNVSHYMGRLVLHHGGASIGYQSTMLMLPADGIAVVVQSNLRDGREGLTLAIARDLLDEVLGLSPVDWTKDVLGKHKRVDEDAPTTGPELGKRSAGPLPLSAYAGEYRHPAYGRITVGVQPDRRLELAQGSERRGVLRHLDHNTFELTWEGVRPGPELVRFVLGADGQPIELERNGQTFAVADPERNRL